MTLDALIQEAARAGRLRSLTIWTTDAGYQANVSSDGVSWRCMTDTDPVAALRRALDAPATDEPHEDIFA